MGWGAQLVFGAPWLAFLGAYAILAGAVMIRRHVTTLLPWVVGFLPARYLTLERDVATLPWSAAIVLVYVLGYAFSGRWFVGDGLPPGRAVSAVKALLLLGLISMIVNGCYATGAEFLARLALDAVLFAICARERLSIDRILVPLSMTGVAISIALMRAALRALATQGDFGIDGAARYGVNVLAVVATVVIGCWLAAWPRLGRVSRRTGKLVIPLLVAGVIAAASRQAMLALLMIGLLAALSAYSWRSVALGGAALVVVAVLAAPTHLRLWKRLSTMLDFSDGNVVDVSARARITAMGIGLDMALDHPLFGVGPGQYTRRSLPYAPADFFRWRGFTADPSPLADSPHSLHLRVADEFGVPALGALLLFQASLAIPFLRRGADRGPLLFLLPFYVSSLMSEWQLLSPTMWCLAGVALAAGRPTMETRAARPKEAEACLKLATA